MRTSWFATAAVVLAFVGASHSIGLAQAIIDTDFARGDFAAQGWQASGAWDIFQYPSKGDNNLGPVARFAAKQPGGSLSKNLAEIRNPGELTLSVAYGWGWGDPGQAADSASLMLLDAAGNGYAFKFHRCKAKWAVQWGRAADNAPPKQMTWAPIEIDARHASVRDGGGLVRVTIGRQADGAWTIASPDWNQGAGASLRFQDTTTNSFSRLVLLGTENFDEQVFNKIVLTTGRREPMPVSAVPSSEFLGSIGVVTSFPDRGQPLAKTVEMLKYGGFRWVRGGIEGLSSDGPTTIETFLELHRQAGVRVSWGLVSGGTDLQKLKTTARQLAAAGALLAFEGNNEPNNWGVTYQGVAGGGRAPSWLAVAKLQRDLYQAVKSDALLEKYPVWSISENGAEIDNVGLQFLAIPAGAGTLLPEGTVFADSANVHNYIYHGNAAGLQDNKTWNAADPTSACQVDGLFGNYGTTWARHFRGYSENELLTLPRVTTETGTTIGGAITEEVQALNLVSMYLDQFKRGWSHTAVYLLRDRTDEQGNQSFGFFRPDYSPRKAAVYLHNLTSILADEGSLVRPGRLSYAIPEQPPTVHDLLLQKSEGTFQLLIWDERVQGEDQVVVRFGKKQVDVKIYDPTVGTDAIQTHADLDSLTLKLSNHPLVVELRDP